jgi:hypothetical protein
VTVALAEKTANRLSELLEEKRCDDRAGSIACVDNDLQWTRYLTDPLYDIVDVALDDLLAAELPLTTRKLSGDSEIIDVLDVVAVNRSRAESKLESVELRRIV